MRVSSTRNCLFVSTVFGDRKQEKETRDRKLFLLLWLSGWWWKEIRAASIHYGIVERGLFVRRVPVRGPCSESIVPLFHAPIIDPTKCLSFKDLLIVLVMTIPVIGRTGTLNQDLEDKTPSTNQNYHTYPTTVCSKLSLHWLLAWMDLHILTTYINNRLTNE